MISVSAFDALVEAFLSDNRDRVKMTWIGKEVFGGDLMRCWRHKLKTQAR